MPKIHKSLFINHKSKKLYKSLLGILVILGLLSATALVLSKPARADWVNDSWGFRKKVTLTNPTATVLTNFQSYLSLNTATLISTGKMKSDCSDIRVYDSTQTQLQQFWVDLCNTSNTRIWMKLSFTANEVKYFYIYYGNPGAASAQVNGSTIFDFFQNFSAYPNGTDITAVSGWTKSTANGSTYTVYNGQLQMFHPGSAPSESQDNALLTLSADNTSDLVVDYDITVADSNSWDFRVVFGDSSLSLSDTGTTSLWSAINSGTYSGYYGGWSSAQSGLTAGANYVFGNAMIQSTKTAKMYVNGVYKIDRTYGKAGTTGLRKLSFGNYGYGSIDSTWYINNLRFRKYTASEPSSSLTSEEHGPSPVMHLKMDDSTPSPINQVEQQINILHTQIGTSGNSFVPTDNSAGIFRWDASKYSNATVYFEAEMYFNCCNYNTTAGLFDTAGNYVAGVTLYSEGGWYRVRSGAITLVDGTDYTVRVRGGYNDGGRIAYVRDARLIIVQSAPEKITDTQTSVDIGDNDTTSSNTYASPAIPKIYNYDSTKFSPAPSAVLESVLKGGNQPTIEQEINLINKQYSVGGSSWGLTDNSAGIIQWDGSKYSDSTVYLEGILSLSYTWCNAYISLYDITAASYVSGSEVGMGNTGAWVRVRSGAITLTDGHQYSLRLRNNMSYTSYVRSARLIIKQSASKITNTQGSIDIATPDSNASDTYTALTNPKIYNYDSTKFTPAPGTASFSATLKAGDQPTIEQEINITNRYLSTNTNTFLPTDNSFGVFRWDGSKYSDATVYLEADMYFNCCNFYATAGLFDTAGNYVAGVTLYSEGGWYRARSGPITLVDGTTYTLRFRANYYADQGREADIRAARLIIKQSASKITKTQSQIELSGYQTGITNTVSAPLTDPKIYQYDSSKFTPTIESSGHATFSATLKIDDSGDTVYAQLYNKTHNTLVATVSHTGDTNWSYMDSTNIENNSNWDTSNADEYEVQVYCTDNNGGGCSGNIANAKIILTQSADSGITHTRIMQHQINQLVTNSSSGYANQVFYTYFNPELQPSDVNFAGGIFHYFFDATLKASAGTAYAQLWNSSAGAISGSEISTTSTSYTRVKSSEFTSNMPSYPTYTSGTDNDTQIRNSGSDTTSVSGSYLVIDAELNTTGGPAAYAELYNLTDSTSVAGSEVSVSNTSDWTFASAGDLVLTGGKNYIVRTKSALAGQKIEIVNAQIKFSQADNNGISKTQIIQHQVNQVVTNSSSGYASQVFYTYFNPELQPSDVNFAGGTFHYFFDATLKASAGTAYAQLWNSAVGGISGSEVSTASNTYTRVKSSEFTSSLPTYPAYTSATTNDTQIKNSSTNTTSVSSSYLVIDAELSTNGGTLAYAELYNLTDGTSVPGSEITSSNPVWAIARSGPFTLTSGKDYIVRFKSQNNGAPVSTINTKLILRQSLSSGIMKTETIRQMVNRISTDSDTGYSSQTFYNSFDPANYNVINNAYFESTLKTTAGTAYAQLYDNSLGVVSGSEVSTASTTFTRVRSGNIAGVLPAVAHDMDTQLKNSASNTTTASTSWLILDVVNDNITSDRSSNNLHARVSNSSLVSGDDCVNDNCFSFNGSNSYLYRKYSAGDAILDPDTSSFTIMGWFRHPSAASGTQTIFSRYAAAGWKVYMNSSGYICFGIDDDSTWEPDDSACSTTNFADSSWHFLAAVKNGTSSITLYIDGNKVAGNNSLTANGSLSGTSPVFTIGIDSDKSSNPWSGFIDEVKYYREAKTQVQITGNYNSMATEREIAVQIGSQNNTRQNGLVGYWKMDETSGPSVDSSGNGNDAAWLGSTTSGGGKFNNAVSFNGSGDRVLINASASATLSPTLDSNWLYRVPITVTNNVASLLTDYQIRVPVAYDAHMRSDFSDLRFTNSSGTQLSYWLDTKVDGFSALVWVKLDSLPASGTATVYMYYGNPNAASNSNGINTFMFFDDFNDNSINTAKWTKNDQGTNYIREENGKLRFQTGTGSWNQTIYINNTYARQDLSLDMDYKPITLGHIMFGWHDSGTGLSYTDLPYSYYENSNTYQYLYEDGNGRGNTADRFYANTPIKIQLKMRASGGAYYQYSTDNGNTWTTTYTSSYSTESNLRPGFAFDDGTEEFDNVRIRKTATTEPTVTLSQTTAPLQTFSYTGADQTYTVPGGVTSLQFKIWGGGGGNGNAGGWSYGHPGGAGGFTKGTIAVTPSQNLTVMVGAAGNDGSSGNQSSDYGGGGPNCGGTDCRYGGQGGGRSAIRSGSTDLLTAGGGGGGGSTYQNTNLMAGGGGGGNSGENGIAVGTTSAWGGGGSQNTGGSAGVGNNQNGTAGSQYQGGRPNTPYSYGGSGGGGWYGGGGGAYDLGDRMGGGGGGSGYVGGTGVSQATTVAANYLIPGNSIDPDRGTAGNPQTAGKVIILTDQPAHYTAEQSVSLPSGQLTVSAWIYATTLDSNQRTVISRNDNNQKWAIYTDPGHTGKLKFATDSISSAGTSNTTLSSNTWYFVTLTGDGQKTRLYINGKLDSETTAAGLVEGFGNIGIGAEPDGTHGWNGKIDEVRIYNRALSPADIQKLYQWAPGPVGWWKLDENTGNTADDSSGNGNTSSSFSSGVSWVSGKYSSGLNFNGNDSIVRIPETTSTHLGATTDSFTVSAWVKTVTTPSGREDVFTKCKGCDTTPFALIMSGGSGRFGFQISDGTYWPSVLSNSDLNDGQWHYLTGVRNVSADKIYLYVDGVLNANTQDITVGSLANTDDLSIGNGDGDSYTMYDYVGAVDDLKIYNYARTPAQIIEDMNAGHPAPGSPVGSAYVHYNFNENNSSTAHNLGNGGSALNGTISNGTWSLNGKFGGSYNFASNTSVTATITDPGYTNTVSMWLYPSSIVGKTLLATNKLVTDGSAKPVYGGCIGNAIPTNTWTHLAAVSDGSGSCAIYQNGVLTASGTTGVTFGTSLNLGASSYVGLIDDFKLYSSTLTADQVREEYNQGNTQTLGSLSSDSSGNASNSASSAYCVPGSPDPCSPPVGYWNFDEKTGTSAYDSSGNNLTGTLGGGTSADQPTWTSGKFGSGLSFDGINDVVMINHNDILYSGFITVEGWVKYRQLSTIKGEDQIITRNSHSSFPWFSFYLSLDNSNPNKFVGFVTNQAGGTPQEIIGNTTATTNTWYHVALTWDGSYIKLYVNGVPDATPVSYSGTHIFNADSTVRIGAQYDGASRTNGVIDDIHIYNYARTPAQIAWDYNRGEPIAQYNFNECTGTVLHDTAPKPDRNATFYNGTITPNTGRTAGTCSSGISTEMWNGGTTGKYSSSLKFDGSGDYVSLGNQVFGDMSTTNYTISAWIKTSSNTDQMILSQYNGGVCGAIELEIYTPGSFIKFVDGSTNEVNGVTVVTDGVWHHVVGVTDNINSRIYIDGRLDSQGTRLVWGYCPTTDVRIGDRMLSGNPELTFNGQIDDVRVYNYGLTAQQVKTLYNNSSAVSF